MTTGSPPLKYLFEVEYSDGSFFEQTTEDISTTRAGGSAFTDVRQEEVLRFHLIDREDSAYVDLDDGSFVVNGLRFWPQQPPPGATLRLIYFRRRRIHIQMGGEEPVQVGNECEYHFGWQCTHEGKNYQQTIILI